MEYTGGLNFSVGACQYTIAGVTYNSPLTNITLAGADPTNPRVDVVGVDVTGAVFVLTGTPGVNPLAPTIDPSTQLEITFEIVPATATTPQGVTSTTVYDENTEWTCTASANFNCASTNNPYHGTKDIEATSAVLTNNVTLVKPAAGTTNLSTVNNLIFYIRPKAAWPVGNGSNAARSLSIFWLNGSTQIGQQVVLKDGAFGFSSSTLSYQQISIPTTLFATGNSPVTTLEFQISGKSGSISIGFYLDLVTLQAGSPPVVLPTTLMNFKGTWSSAVAYAPNDTVLSNGVCYIALSANTNVAVSTTATWGACASNVTASLPGLVPAFPNDPTKFFRGDGTYATVAATGSGGGIVGYSAAALSLSGTLFFPYVGGGLPSGTEANVDSPAPVAATVSNFYVDVSAAPGLGNSLTFTWRRNSSDTSITCTISGASATSCNDTTHSVNVVANDTLTIKLVTSGVIAGTPTLVMTAQYGTTNSNGTVNNGTAPRLAYYAANGSALSDIGTAGITTQVLHGNAAGAPTYSQVVANDTSATLTRRVCSMIVGADNGSALVDADLGPQGQQCKVAMAATVVEIDVNADAGTPNVIVRKKHCSTFTTGVCTAWTSTDLLSSALAAAASNFDACSNTGGTTGLDGGTTCSGTLQNTSLAIGDWIELTSGTAGGTAKRMSIDVLYVVN